MTANELQRKPRVRFAPSPTGMLHVGNARTALYNWLFAKHNDGTAILRIEDTDVERSEVRYENLLIEDLHWLGLTWEEGPQMGGSHGPYRQSERLPIYADHTERLLLEGKAYRCFCSPEQLEAEREAAVAAHQPQIYSGRCRAISIEDSRKRAAAGESYAVRLRIPDHPIRFKDLVRGEVEFPAEAVSDPVLVRSNGMPVYNYVVAVDDALMEITHVIRGDDHVSNTPKQVAIYEAFGWTVPEFAHLSTILGSDRERLSKRHGATSIASFREMGYLPEALMNYLALLGWGAEGGTRETFTPEELVREFKLERVTASPAVFDIAKLDWLNRHYLKLRPIAEVVRLAWPYFEQTGISRLKGKDNFRDYRLVRTAGGRLPAGCRSSGPTTGEGSVCVRAGLGEDQRGFGECGDIGERRGTAGYRRVCGTRDGRARPDHSGALQGADE